MEPRQIVPPDGSPGGPPFEVLRETARRRGKVITKPISLQVLDAILRRRLPASGQSAE